VLKAHFAKLAKECLIQPHHPPVNIVGGNRFPDAPAIDLSPVKPASLKSVAPVEITGDGLDVPEFLRRTIAASDRGCDGVIASSFFARGVDFSWPVPQRGNALATLVGTGCAREICGAGH
jgi:hypothetical protein